MESLVPNKGRLAKASEPQQDCDGRKRSAITRAPLQGRYYSLPSRVRSLSLALRSCCSSALLTR
jgi:hypothetical protein